MLASKEADTNVMSAKATSTPDLRLFTVFSVFLPTSQCERAAVHSKYLVFRAEVCKTGPRLKTAETQRLTGEGFLLTCF